MKFFVVIFFEMSAWQGVSSK